MYMCKKQVLFLTVMCFVRFTVRKSVTVSKKSSWFGEKIFTKIPRKIRLTSEFSGNKKNIEKN